MDVNTCDKFDETVLVYAARENRLDAVKLQVSRGAKVDGCSPN